MIRLLRIETYLEITEFNGKTQQIVNIQKLLSQTFNLFDKTLKKCQLDLKKKCWKQTITKLNFIIGFRHTLQKWASYKCRELRVYLYLTGNLKPWWIKLIGLCYNHWRCCEEFWRNSLFAGSRRVEVWETWTIQQHHHRFIG